jgi:hypothetical protein
VFSLRIAAVAAAIIVAQSVSAADLALLSTRMSKLPIIGCKTTAMKRRVRLKTIPYIINFRTG